MFELRPGSFVRAIFVLSATLLAATAMGPAIQAQSKPSFSGPEMDVALTYAASHSIHTDQQSFWLQGGALEVHARFYRGLGAVASVTGLQIHSPSPQVAPLNLVTVVFGPRYTFNTPGGRIGVFGEVLGGEADGFHSVFSTGSGPVNSLNGTTASSNSLALQTGGGVNLRLTHRLALRAIQVDYLRTQFSNATTNVQNNIRIAAGLVLRIGR